MTEKKSIAIVGAGPTGLMAAEVIATAGNHVTIYDQMPTAGRKFLMAGRGGLNLTHSEPLEKLLSRYGSAAEWMEPVIRGYSSETLRAWCEGLGQATFIGSSGRVFPKALKAAPLLRSWLKRLSSLGVEFRPRHRWLGFEGNALQFTDADNKPLLITADATLLALGGASWPRLGSDGVWASLLTEAGIDIAPLRPSNCGFIVPWSDHFRDRFAGQPLKPVALRVNGAEQQGEMMITAQGIEGGAVYALSALVREAVEQQGQAVLQLDLRPAMAAEALARKLSLPRGNQSLSSHLRKCGLSPLVIGLLRETHTAEELNNAQPAQLASWLKSIPVTVTDTTGLARAISTAGGIMREVVDAQFMLRAKPGMFVAGEMLDWEAPTGGYLLQGCFSTAVAAAQGVLAYLEKK